MSVHKTAVTGNTVVQSSTVVCNQNCSQTSTCSPGFGNGQVSASLSMEFSNQMLPEEMKVKGKYGKLFFLAAVFSDSHTC